MATELKAAAMPYCGSSDATTPIDPAQETHIGLYATESLAMEAKNAIHRAFHSRVYGGLHLDIRNYTGEVFETDRGLLLKDAATGEETLISKALTDEGIQKILSLLSHVIQRNLIDINAVNETKIHKGKHYCAVLNHGSFSPSRDLAPNPYYRSEKTGYEGF